MDELRAAVMFVVIREDAVSFRPNHEACPSFARYLKEASDAGVQGRKGFNDVSKSISHLFVLL